jgi:Fur family ferric uptake transcriptional regulator
MACGESLAKRMRQLGYRVTPQRAVILETVAHLPGHRSAQEVFEKARSRLPGLNIATVYRTLDTLGQAGMIDLLSVGSDAMLFSLRDPSNPHGHLLCRNCERVVSIEAYALNRLAEILWNEYQFKIDDDHLSLQGLCEICARKASNADRS